MSPACPRPSSKSQTRPSKPNAAGDCGPRAPSPSRERGPSDLDDAGQAQAEGRIRRHGTALDLVPIQAEHLQLGEVHDVHHRAEAADGELWRDKKDGRVEEVQLRSQIKKPA